GSRCPGRVGATRGPVCHQRTLGQKAPLSGTRPDSLREKNMLGRLNHVAIATKDAIKAAKIYGAAFGAQISEAVALPEHGVTTVFATLPNTKIEFIEPLGEASPIANFLDRHADG